MIPLLVDAGLRAVAPDLVGFGRSDKPASRHDHTYARHVRWLSSHIVGALDLRNITLVAQDWAGSSGCGSSPGNRTASRRWSPPTRISPPAPAGRVDAFLRWQRFSQDVPELPVGLIVNGGTTTDLPAEVIGAYEAPFPDESYKEGPRQLPVLVPTSPDDPEAAANRAAWHVLRKFERPFLCAFSDRDPITAGSERPLIERIKGARGQAHTTIEGAGHFLQEDRGPELARVVIDLVAMR